MRDRMREIKRMKERERCYLESSWILCTCIEP
jgi:hypothetical protein